MTDPLMPPASGDAAPKAGYSGKLLPEPVQREILARLSKRESLREIAAFIFPTKTVKTGVLCTKSTSGKVLEHGSLLHVL